MSEKYVKLCSLIVSEHFGNVAQTVAEDLAKVPSKSLQRIVASTRLSENKVIEGLRVLVQYDLVTFRPSRMQNDVTEYSLFSKNVFLMLRYPRYLLMVKTVYGNEAELVIEELLRHGSANAYEIIVQVSWRLKETREEGLDVIVSRIRDVLVQLMELRFIMRCGELAAPLPRDEGGDEPGSGCVDSDREADLEAGLFAVPGLDIKELQQMARERIEHEEKGVNLKVNFSRVDEVMREQVLVAVVSRRIDASAGQLLSAILQCKPQPAPEAEVRAQVALLPRANPALRIYLDQYLRVLVEDSSGLLQKKDDSVGHYEVRMKEAFTQLAWATIERILEERFGVKASRVFRLIKAQGYMEQERIGSLALMHPKEANRITYRLLEEHFLQMQDLRKSVTNATSPCKSFYLLHIDLDLVARHTLETCYKAMHNAVARRREEQGQRRAVAEKQARVASLARKLKQQGAPRDAVADLESMITAHEKQQLGELKLKLTRLGEAEQQLDDNIFILESFLHYSSRGGARTTL